MFSARFDRAARGWMEWTAARPVVAVAQLALLVLLLDGIGLALLPPMDRTEVIYAETAREMLKEGGWASPHFKQEPKFEKPLAVLWLQAAGGALDPSHIQRFRLPSIVGTLLAVLFTFLGARPILGGRVAFVAAALLATMLIITVQATLAMPEALMLAATTAAMWTLGRVYTSRSKSDPGLVLALTFWIALGIGILVNVLTVPLIAALTVLALITWEQGRAGWVLRLRPLLGIVVMLAIASLWPLALFLGGTLEQAIAQWRGQGWHLLLGPQEMKWRVLPGLFVLFLLLGMFPAGVFLVPALRTAWQERTAPPIRFLLAWIVPYLLFLELFTRKTPLYMVQAMLPPFAVLFAVWIARPSPADDGLNTRLWFRFGAIGWLMLVAGLIVALWVLPFLLNLSVTPVGVLLGLFAIGLAVLAATALLEGRRLAAAAFVVAMAIAFNNLAIPVTLAGLQPVWVATQLREAVDTLRRCKPGETQVVGFSEPSGVFELSPIAAAGDRSKAVYTVWDAAAYQGHLKRLQIARVREPGAIACVAAYDFIHSCSHRFTIWAGGDKAEFEGCPLPQRFRCENVPEEPMLGKMCK